MDWRQAHISVDLLHKVHAGELPARMLTELVHGHLNALCPACAEALEEFEHRSRQGSAAETDYGAAIDRARDRAVAAFVRIDGERPAAAEEVDELLSLPAGARAERVESEAHRFRSPAFIEEAIRRSGEVLRRDAREAFELLGIAERQTHRIDTLPYGESLVERLRLRALAHRANALRVAGELSGAEALFERVHTALRRSPIEDLTLRGELASLEASLRQDQRRLTEATEQLDRATFCLRRAGDTEGLFKVLLKRGICLRLQERPREAIRCFQEAAVQIPENQSGRLHLAAQHGQTLCLCDLGDFPAARALIEQHAALYDRFDDAWTVLRRVFAEGRIAAGLGERETAVELLGRARSGFLGIGSGYDAALAGLDLAELHLRAGEVAEVKRLAEEMFEVFEARDVHGEALRALRTFQRAVAAEQITLAFIARLRGYLRGARRDASYPFSPAD